MKRKINLLLLLLLYFQNFATSFETQSLSTQSQVSVITCGTGSQLYSCFGHTALRIKDPAHNIDYVYNYGSFNFETPNFYLKFCKGTLLYHLSVAPYSSFQKSYIHENRSLTEQILNLNIREKNEIYNLVQQGLIKENKFYRYQFFEDNCTTRIYDLIKKVSHSTLIIDDSYLEQTSSYRKLFSSYVQNFPWLKLAMNVCLGIHTDHVTTLEETLFLPVELENALDNSIINNQTLVTNKISIYEPTKIKKTNTSPFSPFVIMTIFSSILVLLSLNKRLSASIDFIVFGTTTLLGLLIISLSLLSLHTPTHYNLNLLWLSPLNLIFLIKSRNWMHAFTKFYLTLLLLTFFTSMFMRYFEPAFYPITLMIIIRLSIRIKTETK